MMTVLEYAEDMNKTASEILTKCHELGIKVTNEDDLLDDDAITQLDVAYQSLESTDEEREALEELEDHALEMATQTNINVDNTIKKEKLKKENY